MGVPPGSGVVATARYARAQAGVGARAWVGGRWSPATVAGTLVSLGRGVARGDEDAGDEDAADDGAAEAAAEAGEAGAAGALAAASPWPPSTTVSAIATPAAARTPPATAAPDRKLTSSIRAYIALFSWPNSGHPLPARHSTIQGYQPNGLGACGAELPAGPARGRDGQLRSASAQ
jgi:hypothetical protein